MDADFVCCDAVSKFIAAAVDHPAADPGTGQPGPARTLGNLGRVALGC